MIALIETILEVSNQLTMSSIMSTECGCVQAERPEARRGNRSTSDIDTLTSVYKFCTLTHGQMVKHCGAVEARRAHNPEDSGSKPDNAMRYTLILSYKYFL